MNKERYQNKSTILDKKNVSKINKSKNKKKYLKNKIINKHNRSPLNKEKYKNKNTTPIKKKEKKTRER